MRNRILQFLAWLALGLASGVGAKTYEALQGKSQLIYTLKHPLHQVIGVSKEFTCTVNLGEDTGRAEIRVKAPVLGFNSGNSNRDAHALETLEAFKYPFVEFASDSVRRDGGRYRVFGNLSFHGVKRPLDFFVVPHFGEGRVRITGTFDVKLTDYKVKRPSLLLMPVEDNLRIQIDVAAAGP